MAVTDRKSIGEAIGKIASGAFIVTEKQGDTTAGFLASWVQQAAFEPPVVSLAVKNDRQIKPLLDAGSPFVINILSEANKEVFSHFAKGFESDQDPFAGIETTSGETGAPILTDALAYMECRLLDHADVGDHTVFFGEVVAGNVQHPDETPMVRFRRSGFNY